MNIDAKLVTGQTDNLVELQNGCACCSLSDELPVSVQNILHQRDLDAIVIELSGVADPTAIKSNWNQAPPNIQEMANIRRVVTLVDAGQFGTDYMTWDVASDRPKWQVGQPDCSGNRKVSELLAEQVEAADLILVNKVDLASNEEATIATSVARALNKDATVEQVEFGRVSPTLVLGGTTCSDDTVAEEEEEKVSCCSNSKCGGSTSHDNNHSHDHDETAATSDDDNTSCADSKCSNPTHDHSHDDTGCENSSCSDPGCADPDCTDENHSHSHENSSTSLDGLGIVNFVYKAAIPFNNERLMSLLSTWPVPVKDVLDLGLLQEAAVEGYEVRGKTESSPFVGVLRSKGFCWFGPQKWSGASEDSWRHDTAAYWSHAGKHFSISPAGKWWDSVPREQMKKHLENSAQDEYNRILAEDFVSEEFGDRRQELVFIGTNIDEKHITEALNQCLYTDEEMKDYRERLRTWKSTEIV